MKTVLRILSYLSIFVLGFVFAQTPDLVALHQDRVIHQYQKRECFDKGIDRDHCYFYTYYQPYEKENPTLYKIHSYFVGSEGTLWYVLSGRCSRKQMFHNASAVGKQSGKISNREYFKMECLGIRGELSDLLLGESE